MSAEPDSREFAAAAEASTTTVEPPVAVAPVPSPAGPGARLRAAREARGFGIQQVVDTLHIEARLVEALEQDRYDAFDAPVYARGFLRKYGTWLGLPAEELLAGYDALHRGPQAPSLVPPASAERAPTDWTPWRRAGVAVLALVLVGGSYWWWLTREPPSGARPATAEAPGGAAGETAVGGEASTEDAASSNASAAGSTGPGTAVLPEGEPTAAGLAAGAPGVAPVATLASSVQGAPAAPLGGPPLEIAFSGECWTEVYGADGVRLAFQLHAAGQSRTLPGPGPWRVFLGAADAARVSIGGRPVAIPPANRSGATAGFTIGPDGSIR